ncbi:hypothetical protein YC2023_049280 [Brassica napus]
MRLLYVKRGILKGLKAFAEAIDVVRDKGVAMAVAVASAEDIDEANAELPGVETHSSADGKIPMLRRCQLLLKIHLELDVVVDV